MSVELEHRCPVCDETRIFYRAGSTELHLGTKVKWHCPECTYGFVTIGEDIDSSVSA